MNLSEASIRDNSFGSEQLIFHCLFWFFFLSSGFVVTSHRYFAMDFGKFYEKFILQQQKFKFYCKFVYMCIVFFGVNIDRAYVSKSIFAHVHKSLACITLLTSTKYSFIPLFNLDMYVNRKGHYFLLLFVGLKKTDFVGVFLWLSCAFSFNVNVQKYE